VQFVKFLLPYFLNLANEDCQNLQFTLLSCKKTLLNSVNFYYYIRLMAFPQDKLGKPAPQRYTILDFTVARDDVVAVASPGPYANHLHLAPDR